MQCHFLLPVPWMMIRAVLMIMEIRLRGMDGSIDQLNASDYNYMTVQFHPLIITENFS